MGALLGKRRAQVKEDKKSMSVIDKKLLLEELGKRVGEIVPSGETGRILAAAGEILERFNVEASSLPQRRTRPRG